jgi:hypothetical protein
MKPRRRIAAAWLAICLGLKLIPPCLNSAVPQAMLKSHGSISSTTVLVLRLKGGTAREGTLVSPLVRSPASLATAVVDELNSTCTAKFSTRHATSIHGSSESAAPQQTGDERTRDRLPFNSPHSQGPWSTYAVDSRIQQVLARQIQRSEYELSREQEELFAQAAPPSFSGLPGAHPHCPPAGALLPSNELPCELNRAFSAHGTTTVYSSWTEARSEQPCRAVVPGSLRAQLVQEQLQGLPDETQLRGHGLQQVRTVLQNELERAGAGDAYRRSRSLMARDMSPPQVARSRFSSPYGMGEEEDATISPGVSPGSEYAPADTQRGHRGEGGSFAEQRLPLRRHWSTLALQSIAPWHKRQPDQRDGEEHQEEEEEEEEEDDVVRDCEGDSNEGGMHEFDAERQEQQGWGVQGLGLREQGRGIQCAQAGLMRDELGARNRGHWTEGSDEWSGRKERFGLENEGMRDGDAVRFSARSDCQRHHTYASNPERGAALWGAGTLGEGVSVGGVPVGQVREMGDEMEEEYEVLGEERERSISERARWSSRWWSSTSQASPRVQGAYRGVFNLC